LLAAEPAQSANWQALAREALAGANLRFTQSGTQLVTWSQRSTVGALSYSDGAAVHRVWLSRGRTAIGVTARRLYFLRHDCDVIDTRPEYQIAPGIRPVSAHANEQLRLQWQVANALVGVLQSALHGGSLVGLEPALEGPRGGREAVVRGTVVDLSVTTLGEAYRRLGFDVVPTGMTISVCPVESTPSNVANTLAGILRRLAAERHADIRVQSCGVAAVRSRLSFLRQSGEPPAGNRCLLLVLPKRDEPPRPETVALMRSLEEHGVQFRRAYADDRHEYSVADQLPSLLMAAGGVPHRSPTGCSGKPIWTVGVDLAHWPGLRKSVLAVTLVDGDGILAGAWTSEQPRDETARTETLSSLLRKCGARLRQGVPEARVLVFRDGRMFENESVAIYRSELGHHLTLVEYRKRGNPQVVLASGGTIQPIRGSFAAIVPGATTLFIGTCPPTDERALIRVGKVTWREEWNGLRLTPGELARLIISSSAAPGLGLRPRHLPAALYWADGIAGATDDDLRFRGICGARHE
jgi:hypothetical protein